MIHSHLKALSMKKYIILILILCSLNIVGNAQNVAIRTSATMWATATPNIEVSFPVNKHWTVHLPVLYNPWVWGHNSRFQQLTTMPGVRYWKQKPYIHYFFSGYAIATRFHVGGWCNKKFRYDGNGYGVGVGAGYNYVLNKHWNLEGEIGVGLIYADYDKCGWRKNSHRYSHENGIRVIPTKIDISLVYFY